MNKIKPLTTTTKNKPIYNNITQQDIQSLGITLKQLDSWNLVLNLLHQFFNENPQPLDKEKVMSEYYVCAKLFTNFHNDFYQLSKKINKQIEKLQQKEKI
ncbi:hypothetical protein A5821_002346 [Enterococcus sp. 7F3_DIV0205]|uniref:Uncharacterized protein n=1 Tax=Candidatus Enterococcus palustris TaxID=1834189 RepID=A0AAQ3Y7L6_9ENTE|nr:hypothetical protein [Enterococcus sp. 7F3_DIV0205]OTN82776.1 hypothetical protein A5821_002699 [Enterococcus sp. 7F3_DIV0205]